MTPMTTSSTPPKARAVVVVVNDDLTQIGVLSGLLTKAGLEVQSFSSAASALEGMGQAAPPDLIITDLYMPGIDGWRFCRLLRSPDYAPFNHVPIMAVSATFAGEEAARVTADLGANAFLSSPVDGREFIERVRQLLRGEQPQKFLRVLIVEDDEGLAGLLQRSFVAHGYQADTALTGGEAEARFKAKDYDVVVIDHHLPDIAGEQLLEILRQQCAEVVYLAMTGDSRPELALELMKRGAAAFVRKPFAPQYLIELCAKARRERDLLWVEQRLEIRTHELRQSEERFRQMAANIDSVFWITNREISQMIYVSPAYEKIWGRTCESLYQQPRSFLDVVHPEDRERVMENLRTASPKPQGPFEIEYRIARPDGSFRWIRDRGFPVQDQAAQQAYFVGISDDITERKRAEQAIHQASKETKSILASISDAFFSLDNQLAVTYWNDAAERILHRRREEVLGRNLFDAFPEARGSVFEINYARAAREQVRVEFETCFGVPPYANWYQVRVYPRGDGISVYFQVITERKRLEEDLKAANARLEALWSVSSLATADIKTISDHILKTIGRMTRSAYGFYGFVNEDESVMTIHSWSGDAMKDCSMVDKPSQFLVAEAGIWGEAIRCREPLILNDYAAEHPAKKGLPKGHVPLTNLLVVPHLVQGRIRTVAAVANRVAPYTQDDVIQLTSFLSHIQAIIESKRTEAALCVSEEKHRRLFETISQGIVYQAADGAIISANPAAERILGFSLDQLTGRTSMALEWRAVREDGTDLPGTEHPSMVALRTGWPVGPFIMGVFHPKERDYSWLSVTAIPLCLPGETIPFQVYSTFDDITERKRAEAALKRNETLLRMAGRTARFGGWSVDLAEHTVVWSDEVAFIHEKEPGYSPTVAEAIQFYAPEWREKIARVFAVCAREGTPYDEEMEIDTARGQRLWVRTTGEAARDGSGKIIQVHGAFQDITEYRRVGRELLHKTAILEAQLNSTADGILIVDNQGKKIVQNQRTIDLWKIPQPIADNVDDEVQVKHVMRMTKHPERFVEQVNHLYRHPDEISRDEIELTDGTVLDRYSAPVLGKDGHNHGRIWTFHDITERKRAEAALAKLETQHRQLQKSESLGRMAGAIAHHFNNKLQAVMMSLELARKDLPRTEGGSGSVELLTEAMTSARQAAEVSGLMLTYLGYTPVKRKPLDLSAACQRCRSLLQGALPKNVVLETNLPSLGPTVNADANQLQQALTNLVTNAWEASGEAGGTLRLTVKTVAAGDIPTANRFPLDWQTRDRVYACLEVADTGCGIVAQDIERLFDPFFSRKFVGRGLGLPVVLGIARAHDGAVTVASEPGHGSVFRVFFPVSAEAIPRPPDPTGPAPEVKGGGTMLLVEDEDILRKVLASSLKGLGFTVLAAKDGVEAVEIFRQHQGEIRLVLCDLSMPRMNGWETLAALRQLAPDLPVILSSGYSEAQMMEGHHPELPQAFLSKPYEFKALSDALSQVLANQKG